MVARKNEKILTNTGLYYNIRKRGVFMDKLRKILKSEYTPMALLIESLLSAMVFFASRFTWQVTSFGTGFEHICLVLFCTMCVFTLFSGALLFIRVYKPRRGGKELFGTKIYSFLILSTTIAAAGFFFLSIYSIYRMAFYQSNFVMWLYFKEAFWGFFIAILLAIMIFLPTTSRKVQKILISIVLVLTIVIGLVGVSPIISYEIVSAPMVIDNGTSYSIVFATNDEGTGYVEYSYKNKDYKVYDCAGGKLKCDSKIHSVIVPYEHIRNNKYRVGSENIIEEYSYGAVKGKSVVSTEYNFEYEEKETTELLIVSDWHTKTEKVYDAVKNAGNYDAVVLMGDSSPGVDFEEEVIKYTVEFAGGVSGGTKPIIYLRGNHETRGSYAVKLQDAMGLNGFYYTATIGDCDLIVLDSGEDKESFYKENGGLAEGYEYTEKMTDWLKNSEFENSKAIALSHSWKFSETDAAVSEDIYRELEKKNVSLFISGHTHECRLISEGGEDEKQFVKAHPVITGYMCGGLNDGKYVVSKLSITDEGFTIKAYDNSGNKVFEKCI